MGLPEPESLKNIVQRQPISLKNGIYDQLLILDFLGLWLLLGRVVV